MSAAAPRLSRDELRALSARSDRRAAAAVGAVLGGVAGVFALCAAVPSPPIWVLAFVLVAGLQHHLLIVQHEALHYLLFQRRGVNEAVGALASYLIFFTMAYRVHHFRHHRHLGDEEDPDLANYLDYPNDLRFLLGDLARGVTGIAAAAQFVRQALARAGRDRAAATPRGPAFDRELIGVAAVQAGLFGALALAGIWEAYFLLWVLPLVTLTKTLTHFRNVAEHARLLDDPGLDRHRTIACNPIEAFFFAPLNFNYHAEHHLYMSIPFYNLPRAHRLLAGRPGYAEAIDLERGYLRFLLTRVARGPERSAAGVGG